MSTPLLIQRLANNSEIKNARNISHAKISELTVTVFACKPEFFYIKVRVKRVYISQTCFPDERWLTLDNECVTWDLYKLYYCQP